MASAKDAGALKAKSIIEDVNLMYQNNTARRYYLTLLEGLKSELERREIFIYISLTDNPAFNKAFSVFAKRIVDKFQERDAKYGVKSVTRKYNNPVDTLTLGGIFEKFDEEVGEFTEEREKMFIEHGRLASEAVDVATVCFLVDWDNQIRFKQLEDMSGGN